MLPPQLIDSLGGQQHLPKPPLPCHHRCDCQCSGKEGTGPIATALQPTRTASSTLASTSGPNFRARNPAKTVVWLQQWSETLCTTFLVSTADIYSHIYIYHYIYISLTEWPGWHWDFIEPLPSEPLSWEQLCTCKPTPKNSVVTVIIWDDTYCPALRFWVYSMTAEISRSDSLICENNCNYLSYTYQISPVIKY